MSIFMKRVAFILGLLMMSAFVGYSQSDSDSLYIKQQQEISALEKTIDGLSQRISSQSKTISTLSTRVSSLEASLGGVEGQIETNAQNLASTTTSLEGKISESRSAAASDNQAVTTKLKSSVLWGGILILIVLCIAIIIYLLLRKRINASVTSIDAIHKAQESLQEESVKLDSKLLEVIDGQLKVQQTNEVETNPDHSLALKVADEIVRIETNLSRMDASVKGYKQLSASVRRIKDNFSANGYEFVDMLGKPYNEGIKAVVNFVTDEDLKEGEQIVTGIIKPQINYNGVMIQAAQITVSQNI